MTALHTACMSAAGADNVLAVVELLLDRGAHVNLATSKGTTPLHVAAANRHAGAHGNRQCYGNAAANFNHKTNGNQHHQGSCHSNIDNIGCCPHHTRVSRHGNNRSGRCAGFFG